MALPTTKTKQPTTKSPVKKNDKGPTNKGNLSEGLLGAALIAKIEARQTNGKIRRITSQDVKNSVINLKKYKTRNGSKQKVEICMDVKRKGKDTVTLYIRLGAATMKEFMDPKILDQLGKEIQSAAAYVNSPKIEAFAEAMFNNDIDNKIEVDVDGVSQNISTKSDITLKADDYIAEKISLKNNISKIGQVGGNTWLSILRLFHSGKNPQSGHDESGLNLPLNTKQNEKMYMNLAGDKPDRSTVQKAIRWAYQAADDLFNKQPQGNLQKSVVDFFAFHSTRHDTDVKMVVFKSGKVKTMTPSVLRENLAKVKSIKAVTRTDTQWPSFIIYDASTTPPLTSTGKNALLAIVPKARANGYVMHDVQVGALLEQLIEEKETEGLTM